MSKNEKNMVGKSVIFIIIIIVIIAGIGTSAYFLLKDNTNNNEITNTNEKTIDGYNIKINDLDSDLYKSEYESLKTNLLSDTIDYDEYAKSVAKLFIIDLYTINNKVTKYDVGGVDLVYESGRDNFALKVENTIYKYVEDNSNNQREQDLPEVKSVEITDTKTGTYKIGDISYPSYTFKMNWDYVVDLKYDTTGEVIVINDNNKMYVVEKN